MWSSFLLVLVLTMVQLDLTQGHGRPWEGLPKGLQKKPENHPSLLNGQGRGRSGKDADVNPAPAPVVNPAPAPVVNPAPAPVVNPAPAPVVNPDPELVVTSSTASAPADNTASSSGRLAPPPATQAPGSGKIPSLEASDESAKTPKEEDKSSGFLLPLGLSVGAVLMILGVAFVGHKRKTAAQTNDFFKSIFASRYSVSTNSVSVDPTRNSSVEELEYDI